MKSLQFRRHRQITEPCKYYLVRVIVFLWCVFTLFFVSHMLGISGGLNLQQLAIDINVPIINVVFENSFKSH